MAERTMRPAAHEPAHEPAHQAAAALAAGAPAANPDLDHVPATPGTMLKRGRYLRSEFDLRDAHLVCVGDHDLTSLAVFLAGGAPGLRVSVVDIDDALLGYLDEQATAHGWDVTCYWSDLRLGFPPGLLGTADLVFTDPPYTPEGMALFIARGTLALADQRAGRILAAYGFGDRPALGLAVQEALAALHLAYEAVLPRFNQYQGAEAIGSTAALYQLRPTRRSAAAAAALTSGTADDRIYTHGTRSAEAAAAGLPPDLAARVLELAGFTPGEPVLAGDWPSGLPGRRVTLPALLSRPVSIGTGSVGTSTAINLYPGFGASLSRAPLAAGTGRVAVLCRNNLPELRDAAGQARLAGLLWPRYRITRLLRSTPAPDLAIVVATEVDRAELTGPDLVTRYGYDRPHGKAGNTWREGLISWHGGPGATAAGPAGSSPAGNGLTKAEARAMIAARGFPSGYLRHRLLDLPAALLQRYQSGAGDEPELR